MRALTAGYADSLLVGLRTVALALALAALALAGAPAAAQERTPSPEELWEAYPLDPGSTPLPADPDAEIVRSQTAAAPDDSLPLIVPIMLIAPLVLIAGLALRSRRRAPAGGPMRAAESPRQARAAEPAPRFPAAKRAPRVTAAEPASPTRAAEPAPPARAGEPAPPARAGALAPPDRAAEPARSAGDPVPRRFDWREYPRPVRPAPPPPGPAGGATATATPLRSPWTRSAWRAEIVWEDGFKLLMLEPGRPAPVSNGGGPAEEPEAVAALQDLQTALEAEGWMPAGRAEPWYGRRFVWQHPDPPPGQGGPR